jgi:hypothetical protein
MPQLTRYCWRTSKLLGLKRNSERKRPARRAGTNVDFLGNARNFIVGVARSEIHFDV